MYPEEFKIRINSIDRVKTLVKIVQEYPEDIDISSGRYVIDAKSIMAIFSFDLTKDLYIRIHTDDLETLKRFNEELDIFKV